MTRRNQTITKTMKLKDAEEELSQVSGQKNQILETIEGDTKKHGEILKGIKDSDVILEERKIKIKESDAYLNQVKEEIKAAEILKNSVESTIFDNQKEVDLLNVKKDNWVREMNESRDAVMADFEQKKVKAQTDLNDIYTKTKREQSILDALISDQVSAKSVIEQLGKTKDDYETVIIPSLRATVNDLNTKIYSLTNMKVKNESDRKTALDELAKIGNTRKNLADLMDQLEKTKAELDLINKEKDSKNKEIDDKIEKNQAILDAVDKKIEILKKANTKAEVETVIHEKLDNN